MHWKASPVWKNSPNGNETRGHNCSDAKIAFLTAAEDPRSYCFYQKFAIFYA
jgi:hypothetical protein